MPGSEPMNIYILLYRFAHHYSVSGYNRLADYLDCSRIVIPSLVASYFRRTTSDADRYRLKEETGLSGYFPECRWLEWMAGVRMKLSGPSLFHFVYPENSYYFTGTRPKPQGTKIVATYHQPVRESRMFIQKTEAISKLDGLILLSESQREFFSPLVEASRTAVIHYGIDLEYFFPGTVQPDRPRVIAVGNWLRDFPTLTGAIRILSQRRPDLIWDVVTLEQNREHFKGLSNVQFHSGISEPALVNLYHQASVSVLSLSNAAANTAVLESLACGLPLAATDLPAIREYTTPDGARYVPPGDPEHLAETVVRLIDDSGTRMAMGRANRIHAERYGWPVIAQQTLDFYKRINAS